MPDFYARLAPITRFADAADDSLYAEAPDHWCVVLSDVKNSSDAIAHGEYKAVNMAGAAIIAAMRNLYPADDFPYVFGGDGATLLMPQDRKEALVSALQATRALCERAYGLQLRVGIVPMREIKARGGQLKVARYQVSDHLAMAMFCGGGVAMAEQMVKREGYELPSEQASESQTNLEGLSCRWNEMRSRGGHIVSLMVVARGAAAAALYRDVIAVIETALGSQPEAGKPVGSHNLAFKFSLKSLWLERAAGGAFLKTYLRAAIAWLLFRLHMRVPAFDPGKYLRDTILNSDYRKFDDMLRMVIDCSEEQCAKITDYLRAREEAGELWFGYHTSGHAVMTCFVQSYESDGHVHFIDGGEGGYAVAAQMLKAKQKNSA